jgi:FKBP-type peptidyl-prolyl cis-trans isomerase FkpA
MRKNAFLPVITGLFLSLFFTACLKDDSLSPEEQLKADIKLIGEYLQKNNLVAKSTASGLHYIITQEGFGQATPTLQSKVTVSYKGYFLNGSVFDQTQPGKTIEFPLNGVILGWQEGLQFLKMGGKGTFLLPSAIAYGPNGSGSIPPNTVLLFDVELVKF